MPVRGVDVARGTALPITLFHPEDNKRESAIASGSSVGVSKMGTMGHMLRHPAWVRKLETPLRRSFYRGDSCKNRSQDRRSRGLGMGADIEGLAARLWYVYTSLASSQNQSGMGAEERCRA